MQTDSSGIRMLVAVTAIAALAVGFVATALGSGDDAFAGADDSVVMIDENADDATAEGVYHEVHATDGDDRISYVTADGDVLERTWNETGSNPPSATIMRTKVEHGPVTSVDDPPSKSEAGNRTEIERLEDVVIDDRGDVRVLHAHEDCPHPDSEYVQPVVTIDGFQAWDESEGSPGVIRIVDDGPSNGTSSEDPSSNRDSDGERITTGSGPWVGWDGDNESSSGGDAGTEHGDAAIGSPGFGIALTVAALCLVARLSSVQRRFSSDDETDLRDS